MNKVVLVLDTPTNCSECKLMPLQGIGESICNAVDWERRPSWCPLRPLPEKKMPKQGESFPQDMRLIDRWRGWDACIDEITGEKE